MNKEDIFIIKEKRENFFKNKVRITTWYLRNDDIHKAFTLLLTVLGSNILYFSVFGKTLLAYFFSISIVLFLLIFYISFVKKEPEEFRVV